MDLDDKYALAGQNEAEREVSRLVIRNHFAFAVHKAKQAHQRKVRRLAAESRQANR